MFIKTCSLAAVLLLGAGTAWASDAKEARETLKGIKAIQVLVEDLRSEAERDGITKSQMQTDVELRLRQSGIQVVTDNLAYLYVNVDALKLASVPGYAYSVEVEFKQPVTTLLTGQSAVGSTWSVGSIGTTPLTGASQNVREAVRDLVDRFINAYLSVNPKP
jgi:hypothetical protein